MIDNAQRATPRSAVRAGRRARRVGSLPGTFDVILLSDLLHDVWDVQALLTGLTRLCHPGTRLIANFYSRLWEGPLALAGRAGLARRLLKQNWLTVSDVTNLLHLSDFRVIRSWQEVLCPLPLPGIAPLCNRYLVKLFGIRHLALANFIMARPPPGSAPRAAPRVSVVVPARNEAGNVPAIFARTPEMGAGTELIFVEGHSTDDTYGAIERRSRAHPERRAQLLRQTGKGKGDAVRAGFAAATGDILMILDADLTVPPRICRASSRRFDRTKGSSSTACAWSIRWRTRPCASSTCWATSSSASPSAGCSASRSRTRCAARRSSGARPTRRSPPTARYFGDFDPFGDFDLLFGAAKLGLEIVDLPVRYSERTYGETNIQRWSHGWLLLKMCVFAAGRIKFV